MFRSVKPMYTLFVYRAGLNLRIGLTSYINSLWISNELAYKNKAGALTLTPIFGDKRTIQISPRLIFWRRLRKTPNRSFNFTCLNW